LKCFDFNFRAPYADGALAVKLAKRADVLKLNECELGQIASWLNSGTLRDDGNPADVEGIARRSALLAAATETSRICVTRGARGAVFWDDGVVTAASTPHVTVQDTVGAGDAFMAGLMMGLVRGSDTRSILEHACGLGAFVVSKQGATPPLSLEILELYRPA
jgi:fructokinase